MGSRLYLTASLAFILLYGVMNILIFFHLNDYNSYLAQSKKFQFASGLFLKITL